MNAVEVTFVGGPLGGKVMAVRTENDGGPAVFIYAEAVDYPLWTRDDTQAPVPTKVVAYRTYLVNDQWIAELR